MKLRFRVSSVTLTESRDGERTASVRLIPVRHDDNRVLWELPPAGTIELHGIIPRTTEALNVGTDIEVNLDEAV